MHVHVRMSPTEYKMTWDALSPDQINPRLTDSDTVFNLQCIVLSILYRIGTKSCDVWLNKHIVQSNDLCWYFLLMFNINKNKNAIQISTKEAIQRKFSNLWIWSKRFTPNSDDIFRILELRFFFCSSISIWPGKCQNLSKKWNPAYALEMHWQTL